MEKEKKSLKVPFGAVLCIIVILVAMIAGITFLWRKAQIDLNDKKDEVSKLNEDVDKLEKKIDQLEKTQKTVEKEDKKNNKAEEKQTSNSNQSLTSNTEIGKEIREKLDETKGNELYKKAAFSEKFISLLIDYKMKNTFSDEEIALLLVEIDREKESGSVYTDASDSNGFYVSAKIDDVQKLSEKYFGKKLDTSNLNVKNGDTILVEVPSGFGLKNFKFVAGYKMDNGDYFLTLEQIDEKSSGSLTYGLFVKYDETTDSIIYKGFTQDIISYVSEFNKNN
ncbi:MAG: hypothetical protein IKF52_03085 [Clostridia bacterium]|nr:hypothetical protein [Clostridia bacterium]